LRLAAGGGGPVGGGVGGGGGVRLSGRHDGGRVSDRRLLYHPYFQFNFLSDLPQNMPGKLRDKCGVIRKV